jgi:hypothetical protein
VLQRLLKDEVLHATVGRAVFGVLDARARAEGHGNTCDAIAQELASYHAELEALYDRTSLGGPGRRLGARIDAGDRDAGRMEISGGP